MPRLLEVLGGIAVVISKPQRMRLLIAGKEPFLAEARDELRAGLASAAWISVDDTVAVIRAGNAICTTPARRSEGEKCMRPVRASAGLQTRSLRGPNGAIW